MMIVARNLAYDRILSCVEGRRTVVWTCNTCARLCHGTGGQEAAERLARQLAEDGIEVMSVCSTSASCIMQKVIGRLDVEPDAIISLTCDLGSRCVHEAYGCDVINPLATMGPGILGLGGEPMVRQADGTLVGIDEAASREGFGTGPYF